MAAPAAPKPATANLKKASVVGGGAGVGVLMIGSAFTPVWEGGVENEPYWDAIGKVWTVCIGETNVEMRDYTDAECTAMFGKSFKRYADFTARHAPGLDAYPWQHAAHSDLAYNIGTGGPGRKGGWYASSVRRSFVAGDYVGACRNIRKFKYGGGVIVKGLQNRREGDGTRIGAYELCLVDAVPVALFGGQHQ